ncbi:protein mono-ADP-ribosyltransferase PARP14-like [Octopus sinensis]|uniref:Poly [ADP-ribose] polymerase n=1 Tax=Octopus sinensis TaxID=2607531 RepID=A0A6P7S7F4_9MOLL|nr:protein mono-ADP-ribosyltransferase PARP14-like [Octopus sinensis]
MAEKATPSSNPSLPDLQQESSSMTPRTNVTSRENAGIEINLMIDSISNVSVDVIVNSTNKQLQLSNGSISKSILNAAGPQMQDECNQKYPRGISTSEIAVTKGYKLKCKNVFHLALPPWDEYPPDSILANLTHIITTCLEKAERIEATNLAFPILGAGKLRYPIEKLLGIMYEAVKNYSIQNSSQIKDVYFVVYPQDTEILKKFDEYFQGNRRGLDTSSEIHPQEKAASVTPETHVASGEKACIKIQLMIGSISNASVDVIVNSTNKQLQLNDGSISKFILKTAGPQIQYECNQSYPQGISTSEIAVTKGYNLNCKNVFHLVLPEWDENSSHLILANLTQIITTCLETAERMEARSLAFPILGAGVLKYPIENLPRTMYEAVKNYSDLNSNQIKVVKFMVLSNDTEILKEFKEYFQGNRRGLDTSSAASTSESWWKSFWPFGRKTESVPVTWSPMNDKGLIKIVKVTKGPEYDDIQATFCRNLPSYRIIKIERIQNKTLYQRYKALKKQYEAENPKVKIEVDGLWHGTTAECVERINKYGFNHSSCGKNATAFDEGVSFTTDIQNSTSDKYSTPDHNNIKRIYKCSVLVGKVIQKRHGLNVLQDPYNSTVDNIQRPRNYVIVRDSQAYPHYLITFSN